MTDFTRDDVLKLARLARLQLSDEEVESFKGEIGDILEYVKKLNSVDVSNLSPTIQVTGLKNVTREDTAYHYEASPDELLDNAPDIDNRQIKVKRVIT